MRTLKSLLVALIGLTALMYAIQNLAGVGDMLPQVGSTPLANAPKGLLGTWPAASWIGFALITLCQFLIVAFAFKGARDMFVARNSSDEDFKRAKSIAIWAGGLSLLSWFALSFMVGLGLFNWGSDFGALALTRTFQLGSTSALTILFVNGVPDK